MIGRPYCKEHFDSLAAVFEITWFARNTKLMKEHGVRAFIAMALASLEELKI